MLDLDPTALSGSGWLGGSRTDVARLGAGDGSALDKGMAGGSAGGLGSALAEPAMACGG